MTRPPEAILDAEDAGTRIDKVLTRHFPDLSRKQATRLIKDGLALLNGRRVAPSHLARPGDHVVLTAGIENAVIPEDAPDLVALLERSDVVVVDKPARMPTAPLRPGETGTLANALVSRYPDMVGIGYQAREPGLIHRLDTGTSGVVVAVRRAEAFERLVQGLRAGRLEKRYLAIVRARGLPGHGVIDEALMPSGRRGHRVAVVSPGTPGAHAACTVWSKRTVAGRFALVEVSAPHAYRHQIRAHLAWLGHPIVGDAPYGGDEGHLDEGRHALHASYVAWAGDTAVPAFVAESSLPDDLRALLRG